MNVAIIHFHLNRGGVTQVILNHLRALDAAGTECPRVALLYGGRKQGIETSAFEQFRSIEVSLHPVPELDYDEVTSAAPDQLFQRLHQVLASIGFDPETTLLHAHNHALGKNVSLPGALARAARDGYRLLLQIHDFAEDFRPASYCRMLASLAGGDHARLPAAMYPQAAQIHYAVLNRRDYGVLHAASVQCDRLHLLPNPTSGVSGLISRVSAKEKLLDRLGVPGNVKYLLYPVRGIRRKNIGEALLWSVLGGDHARVGITLPPLNPVERNGYDRWKRFASEMGAHCLFETGGDGGLDFGVNMSAADLILTTSVAEGFGMVFLESWLAGRQLVGRDLPEITCDFKESGIDLGSLYARLRVPIDWIDQVQWRSVLEKAYTRVQQSFGNDADFSQAYQERRALLIQDGYIDFAQLDSPLQRQVVQRAADDHRIREALLEVNPSVARALSSTSNEQLIESNAQAVRTSFSESTFGTTLLHLYSQVMSASIDSSVSPPANGQAILESLLDLSRLHPIRLEQ